jgi:asparagine synthase (glutamine-hydrolysing)
LKAELSQSREFLTETDTEVLLAAYERWGNECLSRLNGMFAFAIWDAHNQRVFLARDRFGEKPLYYSFQNGQFAFGSELKQFLEDPRFDKTPDRSALADFMLFSMQDHDDRTFLRGVKQLRPGHWMEVDVRTGLVGEPRQYWMPAIVDDLDTTNDKQFQEEFRTLLADSVRLRLRSDVRVGLCLSGGLDSTSICALMASQVSDPLTLSAYTLTFPGFPNDESALAGQAASKSGVRHKLGTFTSETLWEQLRNFIASQDGPTGGVSNFASWRIFQVAREDGAVVLLNGQGGDELLGGYNKFFFFWFQILFAQGQWMRLASEAGKYLSVHGLARWNFKQGRRYFPLAVRKQLMGLWKFSHDDFRQSASKQMDWGSGKSLNKRLWNDLHRFSLPCLLHWEDRNSMSVSTEARLPFLDHRIAEAALSTSAYTKLNQGFSKYSLRSSMDSTLPAEVCWQRKKRGFDTPAHSWFERDLIGQMTQLLSDRQSMLGELFDMDDLLTNYRLFTSGAPDTLTQYDWFKLAGTSIWFDHILNRN